MHFIATRTPLPRGVLTEFKDKETGMRILKKAKMFFVLVFLFMLSLLSSCNDGIVDPIGDLEDIEPWAPYLSEEEAEVLFGEKDIVNNYAFDGPYLYYVGDMTATKKTVYRYNCESGEIDFACQDSICTHETGSGCPFARVTDNTWICANSEGLAYTVWDPVHQLEWYDLKTRGHRVLVVDDDLTTCWLFGDTLYFDRFVYSFEYEDVSRGVRQIWRYDLQTDEEFLIGEADQHDITAEPGVINGKETVIIDSYVDPDGNELPAMREWLYQLDPKSGERISLHDGDLPSLWVMDGADCFVYTEGDPFELPQAAVLHFVNLITGEDRVLSEASGHIGHTAITKRCILALVDDPDGNNAKILHCYDYTTGEHTQYPMQGEWLGKYLRYHRGRIYLWQAYIPGEDGEKLDEADYVEWDILTGRQRVVKGKEVIVVN